jgi:hypothetical protein
MNTPSSIRRPVPKLDTGFDGDVITDYNVIFDENMAIDVAIARRSARRVRQLKNCQIVVPSPMDFACTSAVGWMVIISP